MKESFEHSPNPEYGPTKITVFDISEAVGMTMSEIIDRAAEEIIRRGQDNERSKARYQALLQIDADAPFSESVVEALHSRAEQLVQSVREKREGFRDQIESCIALARDRGYIHHEPNTVTIILTDELLQQGAPTFGGTQYINSYDPTNDRIIVGTSASQTLVAHEFGHALSFRPDKDEMGIRAARRNPETGTVQPEGLGWMDEGITMLWEMESTLTPEVPARTNDLAYDWYRSVTQETLRAIGMSEDEAMRAYFGDETCQQKLHTAIAEHFGCAPDDLNCLPVVTDASLARDIIQGKPTTVTVTAGQQKYINHRLDAVTRIFPNVTIAVE